MNSSTFNHYYKLMQRALLLQGMQPNTVDSYLRTLRRVDERLAKPLDQLTPEDLKGYFAALLETYSWSTAKIDRCALVFFYTHVLEREWDLIKIIKAPRLQTLPDVLSQAETLTLLGQVQKMRYRTCLITIYSMGLRISEALRISPADFCSERMTLHIRNSKGNKDRLVPLPELTYYLLKKYWLTHRNANLLFPKICQTSTTESHMLKGGVQSALRAALRDSGIRKKITVHSLRHSYATHLVEMGINLRVIQEILGHSSPVTTAVYTKLSKPVIQDSERTINILMHNLRPLI